MSVIIQVDAGLYPQNTSVPNLCLGHPAVDNCVESTVFRVVSGMTDNLLGFAEFPSQKIHVLPSLSYVKTCFGWNVQKNVAALSLLLFTTSFVV